MNVQSPRALVPDHISPCSQKEMSGASRTMQTAPTSVSQERSTITAVRQIGREGPSNKCVQLTQ